MWDPRPQLLWGLEEGPTAKPAPFSSVNGNMTLYQVTVKVEWNMETLRGRHGEGLFVSPSLSEPTARYRGSLVCLPDMLAQSRPGNGSGSAKTQ